MYTLGQREQTWSIPKTPSQACGERRVCILGKIPGDTQSGVRRKEGLYTWSCLHPGDTQSGVRRKEHPEDTQSGVRRKDILGRVGGITTPRSSINNNNKNITTTTTNNNDNNKHNHNSNNTTTTTTNINTNNRSRSRSLAPREHGAALGKQNTVAGKSG